LPHEVSAGEIRHCANNQFDPDVSEPFVAAMEARRAAAEEAAADEAAAEAQSVLDAKANAESSADTTPDEAEG